jgi:chemotaxis protein MotB
MTNKRREAPIQIIIKKKGHGGAGHGGAWKVAFADFMTAMFCLFLVLWIVNQSSDVKSAIAGYFQDPLGRADEYGSSIMPGEGQYASTPRVLSERDVLSLRRDRLQRLGDDIEEKLSGTPAFEDIREHVDISLTEDGLRIELLEDSSGVFFETGKPNLSTHGREILALLGAELGTLPNFVRIEGHTDAYPFRGDATYTNWELSADRANTARRIMTWNGLRVEQITQVTGFAERQPRVVQDPYSPRNRRITITMLLGEATRRPGDPGAVKPREAGAP